MILMGPKSSHKCPYKRKVEGGVTHTGAGRGRSRFCPTAPKGHFGSSLLTLTWDFWPPD